MAVKSNAVNQISTQAIEELITMIKIWQAEITEAETSISTACKYLEDEGNISGDTTDEFKAGLKDIEGNIAQAKAKMDKFVDLCRKVVTTFDDVKVSSDAKFKETQDRLIALRMKVRQVANNK